MKLASSSTRPYFDLKNSAKERYSSPSKLLKESLAKESELEKPYLNLGAPRAIHFEIPEPDWPTTRMPDQRNPALGLPHVSVGWGVPWWPPKLPEIGGVGCRFCVIVCGDLLDCDDILRCTVPSYCTYDGRGGEGSWDVNIYEGDVESVRTSKLANLPRIDVKVDASQALNVLEICYTDQLGHQCCQGVDIECEACDCAAADPFIADITPETIAPGGDATIGIAGGCPPYSWTISGLGYTLASATTTGLTNTITSPSGT